MAGMVNEAARLLGLPDKTLRRWLDGDRRFDVSTPPLLRPTSTGSTDMTWGEFAEAGLLREYRNRRLSMADLRPLIESLREALETRYPLADARPLSRWGRELLFRLQREHALAEDLYLVVTGLEAGHQLVLTSIAELGGGDNTVVQDPRLAFGQPTVRSIRTEIIAELHDAGESVASIVEAYADFGITDGEVATAVEFEDSLWRRTA